MERNIVFAGVGKHLRGAKRSLAGQASVNVIGLERRNLRDEFGIPIGREHQFHRRLHQLLGSCISRRSSTWRKPQLTLRSPSQTISAVATPSCSRRRACSWGESCASPSTATLATLRSAV